MLALHGTGVSSGIAIGKAFVLRQERPEVPEYVLPRNLIDEEVQRFVGAIEATRHQLQTVRDRIPASAPPETSSFIDTHLMILDDAMVSRAPIDTIRRDQCNAEWALSRHALSLVAMFEQIDDPYIRSRKTDVNQVMDRILSNLLGQEDMQQQTLSAGQIIVASDLTPADTVVLKHNRIRAFITDFGGPISHTAILARSLGIPAIVAVHGATRLINDNEEIVVDGKRGVILAGTDRTVTSDFRRRQRHILDLRKDLATLRVSRSRTRDGRRIQLLANIELPADVKASEKAAASGIGLYRTEFLFMNRNDPPDEEEQFRAYSKVVKALASKPVTIRTLDLGADKQVDGGGTHTATVSANPALGLRAVRLCLHSTELFKPQLRAIYRASAYGKIKLMIPMLSSLDELFRVLDLVREVKSELKREGKPFSARIPIGGMIEVPAAAVAADLFAPHLDFLSIGTNDLIQYTLAIDRVDDAVNYLYDPLHPAILRLVAMTIAAGEAAGIPVSMCGEMAGDVRYTRLLVGMGLRELSMHPATLLDVKKIVRGSDYEELKRLARKVLRTRDTREIHAIVDDYNERSGLGRPN